MRISFDSEEAAQLNKEIFATKIGFISLKKVIEFLLNINHMKHFKVHQLQKEFFNLIIWNQEPMNVFSVLIKQLNFDWNNLKIKLFKMVYLIHYYFICLRLVQAKY